MIYYRVELWDEPSQQWYAIKEFQASTRLLVFDLGEQLTASQARLRYELLTEQYPWFKFRINTVRL